MPDFKTIADFRKDNGKAIRGVCREFIILCRELKMFSEAVVAIDGASSRRLIIATRTSRIASLRLGCSNWMRASLGI